MSLVQWYKLDGDQTDSSGNNLDGSIVNTPTSISGKINTAYTFNYSTSDGISIPDKFALYDFTMTAWINVQGSHYHYDGAILSSGNWNSTHWSWGIRQGNDGFSCRNPSIQYTSAPYTFNTGVWYHVAYRRAGDNLSLYVDGVSVYSGTSSSYIPLQSNASNTCIGRETYQGGYFGFNGSIDDVRIYDHQLSIKEIKELQKQKILHCKFDEYQEVGESIRDSSGYNNDIQLVSGTQPIWTDSSKLGKGQYTFSSSYLDTGFGYSLDPSTTPFSISLWANPSSLSASMVVSSGQVPTSNARFYLGINNSKWDMGIATSGWGTSGPVDAVIGTWYHLVITMDGSVSKLYINGAYQKSKNYSSYTLNRNIYIGIHDNNYQFLGIVDDLRIYNTVLSEDDIKELYISRSNLDSQGNLFIPQLNETKHKPLIMDYTVWEDGQTGSVGLFSQYSTRNSRVLGDDPWGKETVLWEGVSLEGSTAGSGIYYSTDNSIDNTKMYRLSFWEKRVTNSTATSCYYYFGCNGYGSTNGVYNRSSGSLSTNPYFYNTFAVPSSSQLPVGEWVLMVGHIWPQGSGTGSNHSDSGRYLADGTRLGDITTDWVWHGTSTAGRGRTLMIYTPNAGGVTHQTVYPRMDICDGTEPSINELLSGFDSNYIEFIREKGGTSNLQLNITENSVYTGVASEVGITNGLVQWYPLNGDQEDYTINNNNGTVYGATVTTGIDGKLQYLFDGTDDYMQMANSINISSITMWIDFTDVVAVKYFIGSPTSSRGIRYNGSTLLVYGESDASSAIQWTKLSEMVLFSAVKNGTSWDLYINDGFIATTTATGDLIVDKIGKRSDGYFFNGKIQDVRLYNRQLTQKEINILYDLTKPSQVNMKVIDNTTFVKSQFKEI